MQEDHVLVHIDARDEEVIVPEHLKDNPALTLKLSYQFQGRTTHDEKQICTFLKFSGNYVECVIPWARIWGLTNSKGKQQVWAEDLPSDVFAQLSNMFEGKEGGKKAEEKTKPTKAKPEKEENLKEGKFSAPIRALAKKSEPVMGRVDTEEQTTPPPPFENLSSFSKELNQSVDSPIDRRKSLKRIK